MSGSTVLGIDGHQFEELLDQAKHAKGVESDVQLEADDVRALVGKFKSVVAAESGRDHSQDPRQQRDPAVRAAFESWTAAG